MKVIIADKSGFCFGVKRAIDKAYSISNSKNVSTFGPIIHNQEVTTKLKNNGINVVDDISEFNAGDTVIIRSHGVSKEVIDKLQEKDVNIVDATCPFVKKIHDIVKDEENVIIIGDKNHPEVIGIKGWCKDKCYIIGDISDIGKIPYAKEDRVIVVSQTTFDKNKFNNIVEIITKNEYNINLSDTICSATKDRQDEAKKLAAKCNIMLVIGDKLSSNSRKLYDICSTICEKTYFIQTAKDLRSEWFAEDMTVGITAGASTPSNIIEEVYKDVRHHI